MIENFLIKNLTLLERNPRKITKDQMDKLCKSITDDPDFLKSRPILVNYTDGKHIVYAGNQRVRAAKLLKMKGIPCIVEVNLDPEIVRQRVIKDNKTYGEFDFDILANEWDIDLLLNAGFHAEDLLGNPIEDLGSTDEEEGENLSPPLEPKTKLGDLYELGVHRLKCGDSTNPDDVVALLGGAIPILMVTDPPYGVEYDPSWRNDVLKSKGKRSLGKVKNDNLNNWSIAWVLFPGAISYVWHSGTYCGEVEKSLIECEFEIISQIVWVKQHFALSRGDYHWKHEACWYAVKKGHNHNWQGSRKECTVWEIDSRICIGDMSKMEESFGHGTQKPMECMAKPIRNNSAEGEGVYDPFLGSGTTLIACEKLNRICYGLEIDPSYCDVIVNRWCKLTGKKAKRNGVEIDQL